MTQRLKELKTSLANLYKMLDEVEQTQKQEKELENEKERFKEWNDC